jgi:hypothetical protein
LITDHVRPQVAEDLAAERTGQHSRGVEDADAGQRTVRVDLHFLPFPEVFVVL